MKPPCWNRAPRRETYTANVGYGPGGNLMTGEVEWFSEDRCTTWDGRGIGPNGEPYPVAHGWADWCNTCRWKPEGSHD